MENGCKTESHLEMAAVIKRNHIYMADEIYYCTSPMGGMCNLHFREISSGDPKLLSGDDCE